MSTIDVLTRLARFEVEEEHFPSQMRREYQARVWIGCHSYGAWVETTTGDIEGAKRILAMSIANDVRELHAELGELIEALDGVTDA